MNNLSGTFYTKKFSQVWKDENEFYQDWDGLAPFRGSFSNEEDTIKKIYLLLLARYMNSTIVHLDEGQFKLKVYSIIYQYGPNWEKRLSYQEQIRALSLDDLRRGTASIANHAFNPSTPPSTDTLEELTTIDNQNTNNIKKGKLEAIVQAASYLEEDFTNEFLNKFKNLFLVIVEPYAPLLYENEEE